MARKVTQARLNLADALERAAVLAHGNVLRCLDPRLDAPYPDMLNTMIDAMFHAISTAKSYQVKTNSVHIKGQRA
jgi:hypothetical protein